METPNLNALSPLLARAGKNYALAEPILKLRDGQKQIKSKLHEAVQKLYLAKLKEGKETWDQWLSWKSLIVLYCRGEFVLQRNPRSPGYYVRPLANWENRQQSANLINTYRHMCLAKIVTTNPNVRISAGDDNPRSIATAQNVRPLVDYWESQFYQPRYSQRSGLHKLNAGISITRVRWNPFAEGPTSLRFNIEDDEEGLQLGGGFGECLDCPHQGEAGEFQNPELEYGGQCPKCGSNAVEVTSPEKSPISRISQGETENFGAPEISLIPLEGARWDLTKDFEDSSWGIIRHRIKLGDVKMLLGDAILPDTESSDDSSLEMLHNLAYAGNASGDSSQREFSRTHDRHPTACEFWASPEDYADIEIEGGRTVDGDELPAGRMSDIFKKPVCFVGLNDMSLQIGIYYERHREQIVTGQWQVEADSGAGRGIQDAAITQKRYNRWDGHIDQGLAATATPAVAVNKAILDDDQSGYLFKPSTTIKLNLTQLPPGTKLSDMMYQPEAKGINQQAIAYGQNHLMDMFQLQTFNLEFSDNLMNVDPRTLGGSQLASNLANSLFGPVGQVIGQERVRIAEILYDLTRRHDPVGRYYPGKDGKRGQVISGKDLKGKLVFELVLDSIVPTTPFTKRQDQNAFVVGMGGLDKIGIAMQTMPNVVREMAKVANVRLEAEDPDTVSTLCLGRLQQMEELVKAGTYDPQILVDELKPQVAITEPKHLDKQRWWSDWLDLEEALQSPQPIREAAGLMYWLHANYDTQQKMPQAANAGTVAGIEQAAAMAPAALGQQALQPPQEQQPDPAIEQEGEMAMKTADHEFEAGMKAVEIEAEDRRTQTEVKEAEKDRKSTKEIKRMEITSAEKTARMNAQTRAKAAKKSAKAK